LAIFYESSLLLGAFVLEIILEGEIINKRGTHFNSFLNFIILITLRDNGKILKDLIYLESIPKQSWELLSFS